MITNLTNPFTGGGCSDPDRAQGERERAVAEWVHAALHGRAGGPRRRRPAAPRLGRQPEPGHRGRVHPPGRGASAGTRQGGRRAAGERHSWKGKTEF